jgi:hypothetical protein
MYVRILAGNRGGRFLVVDWYRYHKHRNTDQTINWRCRRKECKARVRTNNFNPENLEDANAIRVLFHEQHGMRFLTLALKCKIKYMTSQISPNQAATALLFWIQNEIRTNSAFNHMDNIGPGEHRDNRISGNTGPGNIGMTPSVPRYILFLGYIRRKLF